MKSKGALINVQFDEDRLARCTVLNNFTMETSVHYLDITLAEVTNWINGTHIQKAFPRLNAAQRELLITGITPQQWDELYPEGDEFFPDKGGY
jgi:hypothetical protein